jgi:hypothetical protein
MSEESQTGGAGHQPADEFDVSLFEVADTAVLELLNEKGEPLLYKGKPVTIEMFGPGSNECIRATAKYDQASQIRAFAMARGKVDKEAGREEREQLAAKLSACTKALNNFPIPGGPAKMFANPKLGYLTAQASRFIGDWANFPSASTRISPST